MTESFRWGDSYSKFWRNPAGQRFGGILDEYQPGHLKYVQSTIPIATDNVGRPQTVSKPAPTVGSILRECGAPSVIDYWSLDTEGSELTILGSFPFGEYSVRVLTVEHNHWPVREEIQIFTQGN